RASREQTGSLLLPSNPDLYMAILHSRPVLRALVERFPKALQKNNRSEEDLALVRSMIAFEASEDGLLTIVATASDPELAANLANAVLEEGKKASESIERQLILQQAGHLQTAQARAEVKVAVAERALQSFCKRHNLIDPALQASRATQMINDMTSVRDRSRRELSQRLLHNTEADPRVQQLRSDIALSEATLRDVEQNVAGTASTQEFGQLLLEHEGLTQRVRSSRDMASTLALQVDIFEIRSAQPAGNLAVVRPAVPPLLPAGPSKKRYLSVTLGLALVLGAVLALVIDQWQSVLMHPYMQSRLAKLVHSDSAE
ncbi:MAG: GumC domain-containing protein, partial [Planctomycetota bacterium]